jgi:hypothetical protein
MRITAFANDVLRKSNGTDYTGQTALEIGLRITDRASGTFQSTPATVQDTKFSVPLTCLPDAGLAGSSCNADVTVDSIVPGYVKEGKRTVVSVTGVRMLDAGADSSLTPPSGSCPPTCGNGDEGTFLDQGVFAP